MDNLCAILNLNKILKILQKISRFRFGRKKSFLVFYTPVRTNQTAWLAWHTGLHSNGMVAGASGMVQI